MRRRLIYEGHLFRVDAIDFTDERHESGCPAVDFMASLDPSDQKTLTHLISCHAEKGRVSNDRKSKELRNGIFEFKTDVGARLLWFYPGERRLTILTHGMKKGEEEDPHIDRAIRYRDAYLAAFPPPKQPGGKKRR